MLKFLLSAVLFFLISINSFALNCSDKEWEIGVDIYTLAKGATGISSTCQNYALEVIKYNCANTQSEVDAYKCINDAKNK